MEAKRFFKQKGVLSKTRAQISALKNAGKLIHGQDYLISDLDEPILLFAVTKKTFANAATLVAKNPDYKMVGDYSGVQTITSIAVGNKKGIWQPDKVEITFTLSSGVLYVGNEISSANWTAAISKISGSSISLVFVTGNIIAVGDTFTTALGTSTGTVNSVNYTSNINRGDIVLWDGFHWQKKTTLSTVDNPSDDNGTNYIKLLKSSSGVGYLSDINSIEYDTTDSNDSNWRITSRSSNGLIIRNGLYNENNTNNCQWGNSDVSSIHCDSSSTINILNNSGIITNVDLRTGSLFFASRNSGTINNVNIIQGGNLDADLNEGSIQGLEISKAFVQADMLADFRVENVRILGETNIGLFNSENYVDNFYIVGVGSNFIQNVEVITNPYGSTDPPYIMQVPANENFKHYAAEYYVSSTLTNVSLDRLDVYCFNLDMNYKYYPLPNLTLTFSIQGVMPGVATIGGGTPSITPMILNGANYDYIEFRNREVVDTTGNYIFITRQVGGQTYIS